MEKKPMTSIMAGLLLGLISIVLFLLYYFTGILFKTGAIKWLPTLVSLALVIIFVIKWSNDSNNQVTFGNCFGYGFKMIATTTVIVFIFTLVFVLAFPDFKQQFLQVSRDQMNQNSSSAQLTDEQKEQAMAFVEKGFMLFILGGSLLGNVIIGTIGSLLGAAFAKKKPVDPFAQQPM